MKVFLKILWNIFEFILLNIFEFILPVLICHIFMVHWFSHYLTPIVKTFGYSTFYVESLQDHEDDPTKVDYRLKKYDRKIGYIGYFYSEELLNHVYSYKEDTKNHVVYLVGKNFERDDMKYLVANYRSGDFQILKCEQLTDEYYNIFVRDQDSFTKFDDNYFTDEDYVECQR